MIVYINGKEISLFDGARIEDAVLTYSPRSYKMMRKGKLMVVDRFGNTTERDGPITQGQKFSLKRTTIL